MKQEWCIKALCMVLVHTHQSSINRVYIVGKGRASPRHSTREWWQLFHTHDWPDIWNARTIIEAWHTRGSCSCVTWWLNLAVGVQWVHTAAAAVSWGDRRKKRACHVGHVVHHAEVSTGTHHRGSHLPFYDLSYVDNTWRGDRSTRRFPAEVTAVSRAL